MSAMTAPRTKAAKALWHQVGRDVVRALEEGAGVEEAAQTLRARADELERQAEEDFDLGSYRKAVGR